MFQFKKIPKEENFDVERQKLINLVLGAYRSIRYDVAYVSMPITSGKLMYDVFEKKGVKTLEELGKVDSDSIVNDIIKPNIDMGVIAADNLNSKLPPLAPSVFEGKSFRWTQEEYMTMWLTVIKERAREMHMTDGWEYSNGGVEEITLAHQMRYRCVGLINGEESLDKIFPGLGEQETRDFIEDMARMRVYDINKNELSLDDSILKVREAIQDLQERGFESKRLEISLNNLTGTKEKFCGFGVDRHEYLYHTNGPEAVKHYIEDRDSARKKYNLGI